MPVGFKAELIAIKSLRDSPFHLRKMMFRKQTEKGRSQTLTNSLFYLQKRACTLQVRLHDALCRSKIYTFFEKKVYKSTGLQTGQCFRTIVVLVCGQLARPGNSAWNKFTDRVVLLESFRTSFSI